MNKIRLKKRDINISDNEPFLNCHFGRQKDAEILTSIINSYPTGFVMAINNPWGMGKSTFIKMWSKQLDSQEFQTVYFNAWENDYESSPLVSIISELKQQLKLKDKTKFKKLLGYGATFSINLIPLIINEAIKQNLKIDLPEILNSATETGLAIFEKEINLYTERKQNIENFKLTLKEHITETTTNDKPIIFIIDELDRCRPDYAVDVLENIKHLFSIDNIIFVLSIDKTQLSNSIKGYFGSDRIDSIDYLRRFIDYEYSIPQPSTERYISHLTDYYEILDFFEKAESKNHHQKHTDKRQFVTSANIFLQNSTLRQIEKFFINIRIALNSMENNHMLFPSVITFLVYIKLNKNEDYQKILNRTLTIQELSNIFYLVVEHNATEENDHLILITEAFLIELYNNDYENHLKDKLLEEDEQKHLLPTFHSKYSARCRNEKIVNLLNIIERLHQAKSKLTSLINKIELIPNQP
jgi:hypothetical protein